MRPFLGASRPARRTAAVLLAAGLVGCTLLGPLNPPRRLLEQANESAGERDLDTAFGRLAEIRTRYPESAESREAFPLAASIFQRGYLRARHADPASHWVTAEPAFMIDWLLSFCDGQQFPQAEAQALFVGMPHGYLGDFRAAAEIHPGAARWSVRAVDDNGIVEAIAVERRSAATR